MSGRPTAGAGGGWLGRAALAAVLFAQGAAGAEPEGAAVYGRACARCHGKSGEGNPAKHKRPLVGDWSVARLNRYIAEEMPEDDPGSLSAGEAAAVAKHIHAAFYSPEARARNNPARVELVRLTNRQHLQSVADLVGAFVPSAAVGPARGARGIYFASRKRDGESADKRMDDRIDFDFGSVRPDGAPVGTNGFAVEWRGSILPDETGEHRFVLRTPNGAALWVNDLEAPLIDGRVAGGGQAERSASVRLIGGRPVPFRLEWFRFKETNGAVSLRWAPPHGVEQVIPRRNLAPDAAPPSFVYRTVFPPDDSSAGYERGVSVSPEWDAAATRAALETASAVVRHLDALGGWKEAAARSATNAQAFCERFVAAAFRRPLDDEERRRYVLDRFGSDIPIETSVKRTVLLALKSPRFLYLGWRPEPDGYEVAARLSYGLWDSMPDRALLEAAGAGRLRTREQVLEQARRMLEDPRARSKLLAALHHWLQVDRIEDLAKDPALFPGFTPDVVADLRTSLNLFLEDVVWSGASGYRDLLGADAFFANERLASFYGIADPPAGGEFAPRRFADGPRSGVLTHPYLLAAFSYPRSTSPIHRGVFLARNIVGRELRPPPKAVAFQEADFDPGMTMREKVEALTKPSDCRPCHAVINPLGFAMERYDAVGRYREREGERAVDPSGELPLDDGGSVALAGPGDIVGFVSANEASRREFVEQLVHAVTKQPVAAYGAGAAEGLLRSFAESGYSIRALVVEIAALSALRGVAAPPPAQAGGGPVGQGGAS